MIDLLAVLALTVVMMTLAVPAIAARLDASVSVAATRYMVTRFQRARVEAVLRSASVGLRFGTASEGYRFMAHADGNGNGLRTEEVRTGVDQLLGPVERLDEHFPGVGVGVLNGLPAIDASSDPPGVDAARFGASRLATFTGDGTATPGTLYILGRRGMQHAVRVSGETGRVRAWRFDQRTRVWGPL